MKRRKSQIALAAALCATLLLGMVSTPAKAATTTEGTVKPQIVGNTGSITLARGDRVAVMKAPVNLDAGTVTYTTSNKSVIALEQKGNTIYAKALRNGSATLTAKGSKAGIQSGTLKVNVATPKKTTSMTFTPNDTTLYQGQVVKSKIKTTPSGASKKMKYESSNEAVATVSSNGIIRGIAPGSATITATTKDGTKKVSRTNITVTGIKWTGKEKVLSVGENIYVTDYVAFTPSSVANVAKYQSSDPSILEVNGNALIAKKAGRATLTVKANDRSGVVKTYQFRVKDAPTMKTYTLTFDTDGGNSIDPITANEGDVITDLPTPTKDGYEFTGWMDETGEVVTQVSMTKDITLIASWAETTSTPQIMNATMEGGQTTFEAISEYGDIVGGCSILNWGGFWSNINNIKEVTFDITGDTDCIREVSIWYDEGEYDEAHLDFIAIKPGTVTVTANYKGEKLRIWNFTILSEYTEYIKYENWRKGVEAEIWNDSMTNEEKVTAAGYYIKNNFEYDEEHIFDDRIFVIEAMECDEVTTLQLLDDFAKDLGLNVGYYDRITKKTYSKFYLVYQSWGNVSSVIEVEEGKWIHYDAMPPHPDEVPLIQSCESCGCNGDHTLH